MAVGKKDNNKKLTKVVSTKLSIEDYAVFRKLTNVIHQHGAIPEATIAEGVRYFLLSFINELPGMPGFTPLRSNHK
jgi:hypothetical protein